MWAMLLMAGLSGYAIQPPGAFHGGEAIARDGEAWLALRTNGADAALVPTRLKVRAVRDEMLDGWDEATGDEVSSPLADGVLVFLRGTNLTAGAIATASFSPQSRESATPDYSIRFGPQDFRITTQCRPHPVEGVSEQAQFDCQLRLHGRGKTQTLLELTGYQPADSAEIFTSDDGNAKLLFAGDLDRDGQLDLIFDSSDHYNVSLPTLFLSSQAQPGELVHPAAQFRSVGC